MKIYPKALTGLLALAVLIISGCKQSSMVISKVDYSQPIESVLTPDEEGVVEDVKHGLKFNMLPLQYMETQDTTSVTTSELRLIRGSEGLFYITAPTYRHVYLMTPKESALEFRKKMRISEIGLNQPAFNQRDGYVELVSRATGERYRLTPDDMEKEELTTNSEEDQ